MKRFLAGMGSVALLSTLMFATAPAEAQQRLRRQPPPEHARPMPPPGKQVYDRRDQRGHFERERGPDRMSLEERRKLREDIGQHGREIYRDRRGGRR